MGKEGLSAQSAREEEFVDAGKEESTRAVHLPRRFPGKFGGGRIEVPGGRLRGNDSGGAGS